MDTNKPSILFEMAIFIIADLYMMAFFVRFYSVVTWKGAYGCLFVEVSSEQYLIMRTYDQERHNMVDNILQ
jgi:hypothetical protein